MWLSRFSRELASWRANGINAEISAVRSPRFRSCDFRETESLMPTPSSTVSHMERPSLRRNWSDGVLEYWVRIVCVPNTPLLYYSNTPFLQTFLLHPLDDLAAFREPKIGKRLGVFNTLVIDLACRRKHHLAVHRQS